MNPGENVKVVHECYAAFGAGDMARMHATMAPDISWDLPASSVIPFAGHFDGQEGFTRFLVSLGEHADAEAFEPRHFVADGDYVLVLGHERFRVKATGKTWDVQWAHAFTVVSGKITSFREYTDTAAIAAAFVS